MADREADLNIAYSLMVSAAFLLEQAASHLHHAGVFVAFDVDTLRTQLVDKLATVSELEEVAND